MPAAAGSILSGTKFSDEYAARVHASSVAASVIARWIWCRRFNAGPLCRGSLRAVFVGKSISQEAERPVADERAKANAAISVKSAFGWRSGWEVNAEAMDFGGIVQSSLGKEELMFGVGIGVEADDDLGPRDRVTYAVVKGVAEFL